MKKEKTEKTIKNQSIGLFILLSVISFILINISSSLLFSDYKLDLTGDQRYTLTKGSRELLKDIKPVTIRLYVSSTLSKEYPQYGQYSETVLRLLRQYENKSDGKITLDIRNVEPYTPSEKEALDVGIKPILDSSGKVNLFFGANFSTSDGENYNIPGFVPQRSSYLETDISRILYTLSNPKKKIGIIAPNKIRDQRSMAQLETSYKITALSPDIPEIPQDIDTLIVVSPLGMASTSTYAIEQYLLRGGRVLVFLDSYSENYAYVKPILSFKDYRLSNLFFNLGVEVFGNVVAGDINLSTKAVINSQQKNYYVWIDIPQDYISQKSEITKGLTELSLRTPSVIGFMEREDITMTRLFTTTPSGGMVDKEFLRLSDKNNVLNYYEQSNLQLDMGLLLEGTFVTMFKENVMKGSTYESEMLPFLPISIKPMKLIIAADADMLYDDNWAIIDDNLTKGNEIYGVIPVNNNIDFLQRAVDYLSGNDILLKIENTSSSSYQKSLLSEITDKIFLSYGEEYNIVAQKLIIVEQELQKMVEDMESGNVPFSLNFSKELSQKQEEINKLKETAQQLDYATKKEKENYVYKIIIINMFIFPAILVLLLWALNLILNQKEKKKALELLNESKNH